MNRYFEFFCKMSAEEWERFAVEVIRCSGFEIETEPAYGTDGGKDFIVSHNSRKYIVSCKHYIKSEKHVGIDDEKNIGDRLLQFGATGFIGFYSTEITTGLQERLNGIYGNNGYEYRIFSSTKIVRAMQSMDTKILQSFGLYPHKYYMNVSEEEYKPLKCMICGKDILTDENIPRSSARLIYYNKKKNKYICEYAYGCKSCFIKFNPLTLIDLEIEQALHLRILQGWEDMIDGLLKNKAKELKDSINPDIKIKLKIKKRFYKNRCKFLNRVRQRQLPQTEGNYYGIDV